MLGRCDLGDHVQFVDKEIHAVLSLTLQNHNENSFNGYRTGLMGTQKRYK